MTLHVACCLWDANEKTKDFSLCYDHTWVDKLYRGFRRNLTVPFIFVLFTDRGRPVNANIQQRRLSQDVPDYGSMIEPFSINEPTIIVGLDTIVTGNLDHMARFCLEGSTLGLPRDPYQPDRSINAVALAPKNSKHVFDRWKGQNDMEWLRRFPWKPIDDLWPGHVMSLKFHKIRDLGLPPDARVVYFHGRPKPHELGHLDWVKDHWR